VVAQFAEKDLPAGWRIEREAAMPREQIAALERKFGVGIESVSNQWLSIHGLAAQVNRVRCATAEDARKIAGKLNRGAARERDAFEFRGGEEPVLRKVRAQLGLARTEGAVYEVSLRVAGLPARQVAGWVFGREGHVWTEVHVGGEGWLPVDATCPWTGVSDDYVGWFETSDGEMPIVYVRLPDVKRK